VVTPAELAAGLATVGALFGSWVDKSASYGAQQATTDGFVCGMIIINSIGANATRIELLGYTDSGSNPSTLRSRDYAHMSGENWDSGYSANIMFPVKKNDYWKVVRSVIYQDGGSDTVNVYWIPVGA
jgi:hypothetical protein